MSGLSTHGKIVAASEGRGIQRIYVPMWYTKPHFTLENPNFSRVKGTIKRNLPLKAHLKILRDSRPKAIDLHLVTFQK